MPEMSIIFWPVKGQSTCFTLFSPREVMILLMEDPFWDMMGMKGIPLAPAISSAVRPKFE